MILILDKGFDHGHLDRSFYLDLKEIEVMNVLILRRDGKIIVTVTADPIGDRGKPERWTDNDVKSYLSSKNVPFGECLKGGVLTNTNPAKVIHEWVFEDRNPILLTYNQSAAEEIAREIDQMILDELLAHSKVPVLESTPTVKKSRKKKTSIEKVDIQ